MIVITNYDPFGEDSMIYTFENVCRKYPDIRYEDGLKFIYFNTSGTKDGTTAIKQLLTYLDCSKIECVTNENIAQIHNYVSDVKYSAEVKYRFMTVGEWMDRQTEIMRAEVQAEVRAEVQAEIRAEMAQEMVKKMLRKRNHFSYEEIAELTSLSVAEIEAIASQMN